MNAIITAVEKHRKLILDTERYLWANPETGYKEYKTSKYMEEKFRELGYELTLADGITGFYTVIDTGREELPSILIYGESFTNAIETFAWYSFDEMHSLDMRHYYNMTVDEFIAVVKPDVVVCVRDYSVLLVTDGYGL